MRLPVGVSGNGWASVFTCKLVAFARVVYWRRSEQTPQIPLHVAVAPRVLACRCFHQSWRPSCVISPWSACNGEA
jgi:hypothetical protein